MTHSGKMSATPTDRCRICGSANLTTYIDLGDQPPSNSFLKPHRIDQEQSFPLAVALCRHCGLSQLTTAVSSCDIFDDYAYLSSTSKALCQHYQGMVDWLLRRFAPPQGALVVDIGCNDGITLACYPKDNFSILGIDPSSASEHAKKRGFSVIRTFFGEESSNTISQQYGKAHLITATNVFAHVPDIRDVTLGIAHLLHEDGVCCFEFPYLGEMIGDLYFDTIYHEHLCYFGLTPLTYLFKEIGLKAISVDYQETGASGPALRLCVTHERSTRPVEPSIPLLLEEEKSWIKDITCYQSFARRVHEIRGRLLSIINDIIRSGGKVGAYGAPAKGNTLLNYLGLNTDCVVAVSENNALKIGALTPGSHIPIVDDDAFMEMGVSHALLLAWNYAGFFLENSKFIKAGGKFIIPFPQPTLAP